MKLTNKTKSNQKKIESNLEKKRAKSIRTAQKKKQNKKQKQKKQNRTHKINPTYIYMLLFFPFFVFLALFFAPVFFSPACLLFFPQVLHIFEDPGHQVTCERKSAKHKSKKNSFCCCILQTMDCFFLNP
jgi:Flp pilus assembly protein TadB